MVCVAMPVSERKVVHRQARARRDKVARSLQSQSQIPRGTTERGQLSFSCARLRLLFLSVTDALKHSAGVLNEG